MNQGLTFERIFNAPLEKAWQTWTEPELMKKWWGPRSWYSDSITTDFTVEGKYLMNMKGKMAPDMPEMETWSGGQFKEIIPMKKIVLVDHFADSKGNIVHASKFGLPESFPMESTVEITFEDLGNNQTKLTVHYESSAGIEGKMLENMNMGWNQTLDKFGETLN